MMILIITMSDDQVSKHKWVIACYCNAGRQAGRQIEWIKGEQDKQLIDLLQLLLNQEEFHS
jgi:hypothetical protein